MTRRRDARQRPEGCPVLLVHPHRQLPMDSERHARATAALTALLLPYLRSTRCAARLDNRPAVEASSEPTDR